MHRSLPTAFWKMPILKPGHRECSISTRVGRGVATIPRYTKHNGLYPGNCLAFGLSCAFAEINSVIEQVLSPFTQQQVYMDDIIVTGSTADDHLDLSVNFISQMSLWNSFSSKQVIIVRIRDRLSGSSWNQQGVRQNPCKAVAMQAGFEQKDKQSLES